MDLSFILQSALLGFGLAMDAFSVSLANGLREPDMSVPRMAGIAGVYAGFQFIMPLIGWICVHTIAQRFAAFHRLIPWIAFALLCWIGGKMLWEGLRRQPGETPPALSLKTLLLQGVATSIDALSVGFTIADYDAGSALAASLIIAAVTFAVCIVGLRIGRVLGTRLSSGASILGGCILLAIGIKILLF